MSYPVSHLKVRNANNNEWPLTDDGQVVQITVETPEIMFSGIPVNSRTAITFNGTIVTPLNLAECCVYDNTGRTYTIVSQATTPGSDICVIVVDPTC